VIKRLFGSLQATRILERFRLPDRSANDETLWRESLREMARHFPPSGAELRLLSFIGNEKFAAQLLELRPDLSITLVDFGWLDFKWLWFTTAGKKFANKPTIDKVQWVYCSGSSLPFADNSFDVIAEPVHMTMYSGGRAGYVRSLRERTMPILRPGGRLIKLMTINHLSDGQLLIKAGFARVLSEKILDGYCVLIRGEKPYTQSSTIERIAQTSARDESADGGQIISPEMLESASKGKFVFLLVRQIPDKPVWALQPDEPIRWRAAMVNAQDQQSVLLVFTSLNKAVEFMQSAVTSNTIQGINKVAKYPKTTVRDYAIDLLLNPSFDLVRERYPYTGIMLDVDPQRAVTGEE
jgi:hypothetical protein